MRSLPSTILAGAALFSTVFTVDRDDDLTDFYLFTGENVASLVVAVCYLCKPKLILLVLIALDLNRKSGYLLLFLVVEG